MSATYEANMRAQAQALVDVLRASARAWCELDQRRAELAGQDIALSPNSYPDWRMADVLEREFLAPAVAA